MKPLKFTDEQAELIAHAAYNHVVYRERLERSIKTGDQEYIVWRNFRDEKLKKLGFTPEQIERF